MFQVMVHRGVEALAAGQLLPVVWKQRVVNAGAQLLSVFCSKQILSRAMELPTFIINLTQCNPERPHGHTHRLVAIRVVGNQVNDEDQLSQISIPIMLHPNPCTCRLSSVFYILDNLKKNPLATQ